MEEKAKIAYEKIRDGTALDKADGRALLDWIDKVRVGLWLWLLQAGKQDFKFEPNFRIDERVAHKDRILLVAKYPPHKDMKGLAIIGADDFFIYVPSVLGIICNNIFFMSISSDFVASRHLTQMEIKRRLSGTKLEEVTVGKSEKAGRRINLFGDPYILAQCIMPADVFDELGIQYEADSHHPGWGESQVFRLNSDLIPKDVVDAVPTFSGNREAHIALMELNLALGTKFLIADMLEADFTGVKNAESLRKNITESSFAAEVEITKIKEKYKRATGIHLPSLL